MCLPVFRTLLVVDIGNLLPYIYAVCWVFFCLQLKVVTMILSKGTESRNYTKDVENNLRLIELDSIQVLIECTSAFSVFSGMERWCIVVSAVLFIPIIKLFVPTYWYNYSHFGIYGKLVCNLQATIEFMHSNVCISWLVTGLLTSDAWFTLFGRQC